MGKPQKQRSYQFEPETAVQHQQNSYGYTWDDPTTNSWSSYAPVPNRYPNGFSQHLPATHETLQWADIHRHPISRNNQQSPSYYDSGYTVAASHINTNPNMNYGSMQHAPSNNSIEALVGLGPFYENSYVDQVNGNDNIYIPPDPLVEYINYYSNDFQQDSRAHYSNDFQQDSRTQHGLAHYAASNMTYPNVFHSGDESTSACSNVHVAMKPTTPSFDASLQPCNTKRNPPMLDAFRNFSILVPYLSPHSLSFDQLTSILNQNANDVLRRYLPHVHFLISCQQKLRDAVTSAKEGSKNKKLATNSADFYAKHVESLPRTFYERFKASIHKDDLDLSYRELSKLALETKNVQNKGFEAMKTSFLGGMRDGQSWGLRQWMSKNGGALKVCNELEMIFEALQKLPTDSEINIRVAENVRATVKSAYDSLVNDVPKSYQAASPAHPYLPFFHRLESVLKGLATFDPEDDDVVCLGEKPTASVDSSKETQTATSTSSAIAAATEVTSRKRSHDDSDDENNQKDAKVICLDDLCSSDEEDEILKPSNPTHVPFQLDKRRTHIVDGLKTQMLSAVDGIMKKLERTVQQYSTANFWDIPEHYCYALRLFRGVILHHHAYSLIQAQVVISTSRHEKQLYDENIIHPISLYDIAFALSDRKNSCNGTAVTQPGFLSVTGMEQWNMFSGKDLIEAIDVVFLNAMACATVGSMIFVFDEINVLRNAFWENIQRCSKGDQANCLTKRSEGSSFIRRQDYVRKN